MYDNCFKFFFENLSCYILIIFPLSILWFFALACRVTFIIAFLLLLTGAALNDQRGEESMYFGSFCYVVKPGVFSGGAVLALASVALGIVYYVALSSSKINSEPVWGPQQIQNHGIAMGQPVIPPQSTQPVFVHEDTYNRQQFPWSDRTLFRQKLSLSTETFSDCLLCCFSKIMLLVCIESCILEKYLQTSH